MAVTFRISVIIPSYNARNFLAQSLESAARQTLPPLEILVIDDCSPEPIDDILEVHVKKHPLPEVRLVRHEKNQGLGGARNTGIREARGEWIALLDHDDFWDPGHLESLAAECARKGTDVAFCTSKQFRDAPEKVTGLWGPAPGEMESHLAMNLLRRSFITPSSTLIRRDLLLDLGGFNTDPRVHMCEDFDLWQRLLSSGANIHHVEPPTCYYRKHASAATERPGYMDYQMAFVTQLHAAGVKGSWVEKRSLVAKRWWMAWLSYYRLGTWRWDILARALITGIPVPWEIARGLSRTFRSRKAH